MLLQVEEKQFSMFYQLLYVYDLVEPVCYSANAVLCFYSDVFTHIAN